MEILICIHVLMMALIVAATDTNKMISVFVVLMQY